MPINSSRNSIRLLEGPTPRRTSTFRFAIVVVKDLPLSDQRLNGKIPKLLMVVGVEFVFSCCWFPEQVLKQLLADYLLIIKLQLATILHPNS
ncbi:hypothetical protein Dimus_013201 [Dionaea muscipula]